MSSSQVVGFVLIQLLSPVWLFETPWFEAHQASLSFTTSWSLLKLMPIDDAIDVNDGYTHLILCRPRDSQKSSLAPQFKSINSSVLSLLYGPTLTTIHDYWKDYSFDYMDHCWQSNVFACNSFGLAFCMMYFAYKLNKQGDNLQPWHTPFPILNQLVVHARF